VSPVFTREGWNVLRASWLLLAAALAAGGLIAYGGRWYAEQERRDSSNATLHLRDARTRLEAARRERDSLAEAGDMFRSLVDRGLLESEERLELVELMNTLRTRYQLYSLDYAMDPQRPLQLAGGRVFPSIDVLATRVQVRARALHEGDLLSFMEQISRSRQGFYPMNRCTLRRTTAPAFDLEAHVEAECTLEWITLKDKVAGHAS
jgi:hypothetical protein